MPLAFNRRKRSIVMNQILLYTSAFMALSMASLLLGSTMHYDPAGSGLRSNVDQNGSAMCTAQGARRSLPAFEARQIPSTMFALTPAAPSPTSRLRRTLITQTCCRP